MSGTHHFSDYRLPVAIETIGGQDECIGFTHSGDVQLLLERSCAAAAEEDWRTPQSDAEWFSPAGHWDSGLSPRASAPTHHTKPRIGLL